MDKFLFIVVIVVGILFVSSIIYQAEEAVKLSKDVSIVCREHRVLAKIAKEEVAELITNNKTITPKLTLPGLTHAELVKLTNEKIANKQKHVVELEAVRKATC